MDSIKSGDSCVGVNSLAGLDSDRDSGVKTFFQLGAMYAVAQPHEIEEEPVALGDGTLYPGEFVQKLGQGSRYFDMQDGYYLRYVGIGREGEKENKVLLFAVNHYSNQKNIYFAFYYIAASTLFMGGVGFGRDIYIEKLEKFEELPADADIQETVEQLSLGGNERLRK